MQSIIAEAVWVLWRHCAIVAARLGVELVAFDVAAGFEVTHGLAEQGFVRRQRPRQVGNVDEVEMVIFP